MQSTRSSMKASSQAQDWAAKRRVAMDRARTLREEVMNTLIGV